MQEVSVLLTPVTATKARERQTKRDKDRQKKKEREKEKRRDKDEEGHRQRVDDVSTNFSVRGVRSSRTHGRRQRSLHLVLTLREVRLTLHNDCDPANAVDSNP